MNTVNSAHKPRFSGSAQKMLLMILAAGGFGISISPDIALFVWDRLLCWGGCYAPGVAVVCAVMGAGTFVVRLLARGRLQRDEFLLASFCAGVGLFSILVLLLGLAGWLNSMVLLLIVACCMLGGLWQWRKICGFEPRLQCQTRTPSHCTRLSLSPSSILLVVAIALPLVVAIALLLVVALSPPLLFDVTEYHLGAWARYFTPPHGARFAAMPHNFYARFPFPVESLYFSGLLLHPVYDAAPKVINIFFVLAAAMAAAKLAERLGCPKRFAPAVIVVALAHPVMLAVSLDAFIDAPVAFFVIMAIVFLLPARPFKRAGELGVCSSETETLPQPALSAICFSIALASKYTTAQIYLFPWLLLAAPHVLRPLRQKDFRKLGAFAFALVFVPAIWLAKNVWLYGNPLEPFFEWIFSPSNHAAVAREQFYIAAHHPQPLWTAAYWISLIPRLITLPPLLLAVVPLLFWGKQRREVSAGLAMALFCGIAYMLWNLVGASEDRFLLPVMLVLIALTFAMVSQIECGISRGFVIGLFLMWSALNLFQQGFKFANAGVYQFAMESDFFSLSRTPENPADTDEDAREIFMDKNLGSIGKVTNYINHNLPENTRVLMVFEARPWLVRRTAVCNTVWDESVLLDAADGATTSSQIWQRLARLGYTHVLVNREELRRYIQQYAVPKQLQALGVPATTDHAKAFWATETPEDLFPPFYRDPRWNRLRAPVIAFLRGAEKKAAIKAGENRLTVFLTPLKGQ